MKRHNRQKEKRLQDSRKLGDAPKIRPGHGAPLAARPKLVHSMTLEATGVLFLAMVTAWMWNVMRPEAGPRAQQAFLDLVCRQSGTSCIGMRAVETTTGTTTEAKQPVRKGTLVIRIPRHVQIWDSDALSSPSIQQLLGKVEEPEDRAAILALYIAQWRRKLRDDPSFYNNSLQENPVIVDYLLNQLPAYEHFENYHPIFWDDDTLADLLVRQSFCYAYVKEMQQAVHDEYVRFSGVVDRQDYYAARLSVLTRAFGTQTAVDGNGSFAMVPVLDSFDHRSPPNVGFAADADGNFVVTALDNFRGRIHDNYGKRSDPNLFARYGFINGDGMEHTQAGINLWHPVQLEETGDSARTSASRRDQYRIAMLRYLQYDDGYAECVAPVHEASANPSFAESAWHLKQLKYRFLLNRAHSLKHWVVTMSPRNKERKSGVPELELSRMKFNATMVFSTCRLLSLTHEDYDGQAASLLETHMNDLDFVLPATRDGLEFRTLFCMSRMTSTALDRFATSVEAERDTIPQLEPGSSEWMAAHLRLGELQTLQALRHVSFSKLRANYGDDLLGSSSAFLMRNQPCPKELLKPLVDIRLKL